MFNIWLTIKFLFCIITKPDKHTKTIAANNWYNTDNSTYKKESKWKKQKQTISTQPETL